MTLRILYVDDEPDIREIACMSLELDPDFEVRSCASGVEAVAIAAGWRPHLILLDVMMPGMDGPATLAALRAYGNGTRVVFITARSQGADLELLNAMDVAGTIAKPFDPMTLAATVRGFAGR
jgi:CheY-like chemotaxis protein